MAEEKKTPLFRRLVQLASNIGLITKQKIDDAKKWFRTNAQQLSSVNAKDLMSDPKQFLQGRDVFGTNIGQMLMFYYDPKTKEQLPYYDRFPLIFVVDLGKGEKFYGINMHYLSPFQRAKLMDALYRNIQINGKDEKRRLAISYQILKSASNLSAFRPCFKAYLTTHVRSKFYVVKPEDWDTVLCLPTERFEQGGGKGGTIGAYQSKYKVWSDSLAQINKTRRRRR